MTGDATIFPTAFLVDEDPVTRKNLESACGLLGVRHAWHANGNAFLETYNNWQPGCVIADLTAREMSGLELQGRLSKYELPPPVIFVASQIDLRVVVEAMSNGAQTVLEKPLLLDELTSHVRRAINADANNRSMSRQRSESKMRFEKLTQKEREVFDLVVQGYTNRQVSQTLDISVRAVEDRRSRLMRKLEVKSVAELVRLLH